MTKKDKSTGDRKISTGGGSYIEGGVQTGGGDFVAGAGARNVKAGERGIAVGGDVNGSTFVTGDGNIVGSKVEREKLFEEVHQKIEARPNTAPEDKADLQAEVKEIQTEAAKEDKADEAFLSRRLRNLKRMAPDILEVVTATLVNPLAGFGLAVKKIAEKAKETAG